MNKSQLKSVQNSGQNTLNPEVMAFFAKLEPAHFYVVIDREVDGVPVKHIRISPMFDNDTEALAFLAQCGVTGAYFAKACFWA